MFSSLLPDELYTIIINQLARSYDEKEDHQRDAQLAACCLVSKAFLFPSRRQLYRIFDIVFNHHSSDDHEVARQTIRSSLKGYKLNSNRHLLDYLLDCTVSIDLISNQHISSPMFEHEPAQALATVLGARPQLTRLAFNLLSRGDEDAPRYFTHLCDVVSSFKPKTTEFDVFNGSDDNALLDEQLYPPMDSLPAALLAMPALTTLSLSGLSAPPGFLEFKPTFQLVHLNFNVTGFGMQRFFQSITSSSHESLTLLGLHEIMEPVDLGAFQKILALYSDFSIWLSNYNSDVDYVTAGRRFVGQAMGPTLQTLRLSSKARFNFWMMFDWHSDFPHPVKIDFFNLIPIQTCQLKLSFRGQHRDAPIEAKLVTEFMQARQDKQHNLEALRITPRPKGGLGEIRDLMKVCRDEEVLLEFGDTVVVDLDKEWVEPNEDVMEICNPRGFP
ncbi:hypothetical protein T439DRAFT_345501 [Meredithblackwellia eburnea MCA 4105]